MTHKPENSAGKLLENNEGGSDYVSHREERHWCC